MTKMLATTEQIIEAYQTTGSVWRAAQKLNLSGQSVWERLRGIGYPLRGRNWSADENSKLREMVGHYSITQTQLGTAPGGA